MKTEIKIEKCSKPFCVIHTESKSPAIQEIAEKIRRMDESGKSTVISAWDGDYCLQIRQEEIFRIYSMDKKVYVETEKECLLLKMRLYEFEELAQGCGWFPHNLPSTLIWFGIFLVIYIIFWFSFYSYYKRKTKEINESLKK